MCRLVWTMFIVTIVVGGTNGDYSARSWGDPHITTVDKKEYDFNGHGEYTFLKTGSTTVQVRADYKTSGNKDDTIFVAVAIKDDIGQFEAQLINRTSGDVTVYKAGVAVCSSNDSPPQGVPSNAMFPCGGRGVLVGNGKVSFGLKGFGSYLKTLTLQGGSEISITLDGVKDNISPINLTGLAGGSVNIKATDGTLFNVSKPSDMFEFGESLRISENESLFNYSLSSGNYSTYNTFSRPTFYEDYLTNLTELFNLKGHHNNSDIDEFNKTCNESKVRDECLLAIARSDDVAAGEAVNINYRQEQYLYYMRHNKPPYFTDEIADLDVYLADNHSVILNLSNYVHDNNTGDILTFLVETNLPKTNFTLDSVSGIFNWTVQPSLRHMNGSIKITFTVNDKFNGTVVKDVEVKFCGCNKTSQCDKEHSDKCNCQDDKYVTGDYCETRLDPCNVTTCFNQSLCNVDNIGADTGPCAPCPKGRYSDFQSDKQICHDVDECDSKYDGDDKCDVNSNCNNTDGSYTCTCHHGYRIMSNGYKCEDEDECLNGTKCGENEICRNTVGSYTCDCIGGYGKEAGKCIKLTGVSFVLSTEWYITAGFTVNNQPDTPDNRDIIKNYLTVKLNGSVEGFVDIEIVSISILTINNTHSNRVRRTPGNQLLSVVYIFHLVNYTMDKTILSVKISERFDTTPPNVTGIQLENMKPQIPRNEDGLCSLPGRTECDLGSTVCRDSNGSYACDCKHGYERKQQSILNLCNDINECLNTSYVDQCTTHGGVCQNLHGSWNCTCPHDTVWMDVGTEETPIYRCQKNHTYVGNVTFVSIFNITEDYIRDVVIKKLNTALSNSTVNGSTDPPLSVKQLFVSSTIKKINWKHESHSEFYEVMFTLRFGLPMATRTLQDILSSLPTRDGDIYDMHFVVFNESENKLCDFPNECEVISTICRTENGTLQCTCKDGFIKSSSPTICLDRDECQEHGYCLQGDCQNTHGSWICQCPSGYENNTTAPNKITCQDIDECNDTHKNKCENGNCTNTNGSYICQCHIGFVNNDNDNTTCHDIDECADVNQCRDGTCVNTNGSYKCDCHDGYHHDGNDNITCLDMNECNDTNQCRDGKCINTNGSFICECYDGFHHNGNDKTTCLDINECTNQTRCHNGICSNTVGSWHCDCFNGYQHNDTDIQSCIDINECQQYTNACSGSVSSFFPCVNLMGSWRCNCESGHPVDFNATSKLCSGVFRYLAYLLIAPHNKTNANNSLQMFIQQEFFSYYVQKFPNDGMKVTTLEIIFRPDNSSISAMFVLTFDILKSKDDIEKEWKIFKDKTCDPVCNSNGTMFFISPGDFILEGKNKGICTLQNTCNVESTDCISNNGQTTFECKSGFHKSSESSSCCEDINECTNTLCDNGTCINTNGSWHCDCYYGFKHTDSKNQSCEGDKQTIQVLQSSFTFTVTVSPDMTVLKTTLSKIIMDAYESKYNRSDIFVIILNITTRSEQTNRFVRDTSADSSKGIALLCMYEVHFTTPAPVIPEQKTLTAYLNEHQDSPAYSDMDIHLQAEEAITVHEAATTTKTSTTTASTTATPPKSKTTDESAKGTKTMLIAIGSSLGGLVVILTVLVGCLCWRKRQPEKTKLDSMPEHITMDTFGPGHDFKGVNPAYSSSHHLNQSVMYDHFHGGHGSFNNAPYHRSREELSNSYNHAFHHQNRESLYRTSSLPGLPRIENGAVKMLPSGEPQRPPSPIPDYHDPDVRGHGRNPPSPKPDYMPHHEHNFESKRSYPIQNGIHDHVVRNGVSVLPMARPRSMDNLAPNYNHLPSGPIYSQPHKQRRGSFGNY